MVVTRYQLGLLFTDNTSLVASDVDGLKKSACGCIGGVV